MISGTYALSFVTYNYIGGIMVSVLASSAVGQGLEVKPKTIKLAYAASAQRVLY